MNAVAAGNIVTPMVLNEHMFHMMRPDLEHPSPAPNGSSMSDPYGA